MNSEEQREAIAFACGWKYIEDHCHKNISFSGSQSWGEGWKSPKTGKVYADFEDLPKYLTDLNAMHEAEKILKEKGSSSYYSTYQHYIQEASKSTVDRRSVIGIQHMITATAAQRAEAFLKALNLWKE